MTDQTLPFDLFTLPTESSPQSSCGRTSPECSVPRTTPSGVSWRDWLERMPHSFRQEQSQDGNAGSQENISHGQTRVWLLDDSVASVGLFSTVNFGAWRRGGSAVTLSQVLEADVAPKYYLSPRAAAGILRRAEKRGKALPEQLEAALRTLAGDIGPT